MASSPRERAGFAGTFCALIGRSAASQLFWRAFSNRAAFQCVFQIYRSNNEDSSGPELHEKSDRAGLDPKYLRPAGCQINQHVNKGEYYFENLLNSNKIN